MGILRSAALLGGFLLLLSMPGWGVPEYRFHDLGVLGAGDLAVGYGINDNAWVVGSSKWNASQYYQTACRWSEGSLTNLGTLGGYQSTAYEINNSNVAVGWADVSEGNRHACLWDDNGPLDISTGDYRYSVAMGINELGRVVGAQFTDPSQHHAFFWEDGVLHDLGTLGYASATAMAINNANQIAVSVKNPSSSYQASLYDDGNLTVLPGLGGGTTVPRAVNDAGQVVGESRSLSGQNHAVLWDNGTVWDLGTLGDPDLPSSLAWDINNRGQVVGWKLDYDIPGSSRAFLWEDGVMYDITPPGASASARSISDNGWIAGSFTLPSGEQHAAMWELVPEPGSLAVLLLGLGTLGVRRRAQPH